MRKGPAYLLIALLLLMAGFKLVRQDLVYLDSNEVRDFVYFYIPGNAWMAGGQPYERASVAQEAVALYGPDEARRYTGINSYYPPSAFVALLPILLLPHQAIAAVMGIVSLGSYLWLALILARQMEAAARLVFLAFALNFAPLHSALRPANVAVLVTSLLLIPLLASMRNPHLSAGWFVFVGLGAAIKPQLGIPFLLLLLAMRGWKRLTVATATVAACAAIATGWMAMHGVHWLAAFLEGLRQGPSTTDLMRETTESFVYNGMANFRLIDLSPVVYLFSSNAWLSRMLPAAIGGTLLLCLLVLLWRRRGRGPVSPEIWSLSICAFGAAAILPVYSRFYGALLLLPFFAWLWTRSHGRGARAFLILGAILFSLPMPQFPTIWEAGVVYLKHPSAGFQRASALLTAQNGWAVRPAPWQELICALPNLWVLAACFLLLGMIVRRTRSEVRGRAMQST